MTASRWMHMGTILKMNARNYPEKLGWQDTFKEYSFKDWNGRACRLANGLKDLGVRHQETFAVIAYNRGSMPELIVHGKTGFIVENLSEAIDAVDDIGKIERKHCLEWVQSKFTREKMVEGYLEVYEQVLSRHSAGATR